MGPDVVVVGAGVIGASIAYHLRRRGASVLVADPGSPAPPSASWASAGGVRRQLRDRREWRLAIAASHRWPGLADELGADCGFRAGGHLQVAETEAELEALAREAAAERAGGIGVEMRNRAQTLELAPILAATVAGGAFTAGDGQADPRLTTRAFLEAAVREGAGHRCQAVEGFLLTRSGRLEGVRIGETPLRAEAVVLAAGSWTARLAGELGVQLPIEVQALQMLRTDPTDPVLGPTVGAQGRLISMKQLPGGAFFIGGGWPGDVDPIAHTCGVRETSVRGSWATAIALFPNLAERVIADRHCGLEGVSFDGSPLIGRHPAREGLYVAAGFSGHGFQLAPAVGEAVAADLTGAAPAALAGLAADRRPPAE